MEKGSSEDQEFFDDCPICRAMKEAKNQNRELSLSELKEAFRQAKEEGAVVGSDEL